MNQDKLLKAVLGEEVFEGLKKALEKLNTRSVVDIQELNSALKVVPKAVMSFLIRELKPMKNHEAKEIKLPYHDNAMMLVNKDDADVYHGQISQDGKLVHDFDLVSIPQLAAHLVSNYELYDMKRDEASEATIAAETEASMLRNIRGEESSSESTSEGTSSVMEKLKETPVSQQGESTRMLVEGKGAEPKAEGASSEVADLKHDLLGEKIKVLEGKIDQIMIMLSQQKPQEKVQKSESRAVLAKIKQILSTKALAKAGLMPTMPKPPGAGTNAGGANTGITHTGFHDPKSAATDLPGHNLHTGVKNPFLKLPKPAAGAPKTAKPPKQPKTSFTAAKSEGTSRCGDCGDILMKSGEYVGCSCFKALSKPTLKKNESSVTYILDSDWDTEDRYNLWLSVNKGNKRG